MPERNQFIFIIRGRTRSGKTTLVDKVSEELKFEKIVIDEIKKSIPKNIPNRTSTIFEKAGEKANKLLKQDKNIIVEEAFLDKKHLEVFFQMIEEKEKYKIQCILLECSLETAMSRKINLGSKTIQHQFNKRLDKLENELILNTDEMSKDEVFDQIKKIVAEQNHGPIGNHRKT